MTKKHFKAIADALAAERKRQTDVASYISVAAVDLVAVRLADALAAFNPAFDRARFLRACRGEA